MVYMGRKSPGPAQRDKGSRQARKTPHSLSGAGWQRRTIGARKTYVRLGPSSPGRLGDTISHSACVTVTCTVSWRRFCYLAYCSSWSLRVSPGDVSIPNAVEQATPSDPAHSFQFFSYPVTLHSFLPHSTVYSTKLIKLINSHRQMDSANAVTRRLLPTRRLLRVSWCTAWAL